MPLIELPPDALAETYARSCFELTDANGGQALIEQVAGELEDILELARTDPRFSEFLASQVLSAAERAASLDRILAGRVHQLTLNFLQILNRKDRLSHLPAIIAALDALVQHRFGRVEVDVYTASPASPAELKTLKDRLSEKLGREAVVHPYTDRSMIGGIRLRIGDQLVDASLSTQLRALKGQLGTTGSASIRSRSRNVIQD